VRNEGKRPVNDPYLSQTLNDYQIVKFRNQGAFSRVYEANHIPTGSDVAVKILNPNATPDQIREFDNEADLLVKLSGATRVVNILDTQTAQL
jgi:serine/threonine protein kinase